MTTADGAAGRGGERAELYVLSGPDVGRSFAVFHGATLGRSPDRDVVFRDRSISRHHAHFERAAGQWMIVDDGSTNGFLVDGARSERATLTDLGEFVIGEVLVRLRLGAAVADAAVRAAPASAPAPSSRPVASSPAAAPRPELDLGDEIEIDAEPEATRFSPPARPASTPFARAPGPEVAPAAAPSVEPRAAGSRGAGTPGASGLPGTGGITGAPGPDLRGRRILQFHKEPARHGLFVTDLEQRSPWVRALAVVLGLALAGALAYAVYRGVLSLRESSAGTPEPAENGEPAVKDG